MQFFMLKFTENQHGAILMRGIDQSEMKSRQSMISDSNLMQILLTEFYINCV